jgi:hypothetical protein
LPADDDEVPESGMAQLGTGTEAAGFGATRLDALLFAGALRLAAVLAADFPLDFRADFFGDFFEDVFADFLDDFFADFFADFLADFFDDFFAVFFFADVLTDFFFADLFADFFFAATAFLPFLAFAPVFFLDFLAIVILLLPPIIHPGRGPPVAQSRSSIVWTTGTDVPPAI